MTPSDLNKPGKNPMDMTVNRSHVNKALRYLYPIIQDASCLAWVNRKGPQPFDDPPSPEYLKAGNIHDSYVRTLATQQTFVSVLERAEFGYGTSPDVGLSDGKRYVCAGVKHDGLLIGAVVLFSERITPESVMAVRTAAAVIEAMLNKPPAMGVGTTPGTD